MQKHSAVDLVAAMLKSMTKEPDQTPIKLTDEAPLSMRRDRNRGGSSNNRQRSGRSSSVVVKTLETNVQAIVSPMDTEIVVLVKKEKNKIINKSIDML